MTGALQAVCQVVQPYWRNRRFHAICVDQEDLHVIIRPRAPARSRTYLHDLPVCST